MDDSSIDDHTVPMRAAVLEARGKLTLEDRERPPCPFGGAMIEVSACSVCSTDVKMLRNGHRDLTYPRVLGHEMVGTVVESRSPHHVKGERVQVFPGIVCGSCPPCRKGAENQCPGVRIAGFNHDGGFATNFALPRGGRTNRIPDGVGDDVAALAEPIACCVNAQQLTSVGDGDAVLILGAGPMGCLHSLVARHRGAGTVTLIDPLEDRRAMARRANADLVASPQDGLDGMVAEMTDGLGADVIILASRDVPIDDTLLSLLAPRGRISVFSCLPGPLSRPGLDMNTLHYAENAIVGAYGCTNAQNREALSMLEEGLDVGWLITGRFPLSRIHEAFAHAEDRNGLKALVDDMEG